jgi:hypothetical protein
MLRRRTDLHSAVGGVNLFRGHRFARYHIEIPVAACIVAPASTIRYGSLDTRMGFLSSIGVEVLSVAAADS